MTSNNKTTPTTTSSSSNTTTAVYTPEASEKLNTILKLERTSASQLQIEKEKRGIDKTEILDKMTNFLEEKFYHELTGIFVEYISEKENFSSFEKVEFFKFVISPLSQRLNKLRVGFILSVITDELEPNDSLAFLDFNEKLLTKDEEAYIHFKTRKAFYLTRLLCYKEASEVLEDVKISINERLRLPPSVNASYHRSSANLQKAQAKHSDFFKHAILYLAYTPLQDIPIQERNELAYEIAVSAILAEDTFNFNELHAHPLICTALPNSSNGWIYELLEAFSEGKLTLFDEVVEKYRFEISKSVLEANSIAIRRKMTLLSLMDLCFHRNKTQKLLTFDEIKDHCKISINEIELLIMKAMCNKLISGYIDEVKQTLRITWVQPRILDNARIKIMKDRVDSWADTASRLLLHLEELTPELLVS